MKKILKWSLVLLPILATGCKDDIIPSEPVKPAYSGDDVVFTFANRGHDTRTMYQDNWDEKEKQYIYWGNYLSGDPEQIKIYCRQAKDILSATYTVKPNATTPSHVAVDVTKLTEDGIQWSSQGKTYDFYAFYPAAKASDLQGTTGNIIQAEVETGQSPRLYKRSIKGGAITTATLQEIAENNTASLDQQTVVYAEPDMEAAIMLAHTQVSGTPDEANQTGYGYPVSLDFHVLADVLDLTINGPVKPNSLGGNAQDKDAERKFIKIMSVDIKNAGTGKKTLAGTFTIDMAAAADAQSTDDLKNAITVLNGTDQIQIQTANEGQYPTLHVRQPENKDGAPAAGEVDQLRIRTFIMPGQITNLDELEVTLHTDCGDYTQPLSSFAMVSGAIHPIKLSYFKTRGTEFDYKRWVGQLDDNIYLSELSIPGTWHSSNSTNQGSATLEDQYNAGIRAFEVHTLNGTKPKDFNDLQKDLDYTTAEYQPQKLNDKSTVESQSVTGSLGDNVTTSGGGIGQTTRTVTATNMTVTQTRTYSYSQKPYFGLRLYRTRNVYPSPGATTTDPEESFSDALIELADIMNPDGIMFFEFGWDDPNWNRTATVNLKTTTVTQTITVTGVTVTGTQTRQLGSAFDNLTLDNVKWDDLDLSASDQWKDVAGSEKYDYNSTTTIPRGEAWAIAVESCIRRLRSTANTNTKKSSIVYPDQITANTTLGDVRGYVIIKINTNGTENEGDGWSSNTPALFSRWENGSGTTPLTINLQWGKPIAPYSGTGTSTSPDPDNNALHWCYTELENVPSTSMESRIKALSTFSKVSFDNYKGGLHRTFYECAIGGYSGSNTASGCQTLAKSLNKALLDVLTNPSRNACPFGLVFMNYAIAPNDDQDNYHSKDLIRTIINNNAAFLLNRRGGSSKNVNDNTNSSFTNNSGDPLK